MTQQVSAQAFDDFPGADAESPRDIPASGWLEIVKRAWAEAQAIQIPLLAAGVAFFGFLALFPTLIALVFAYGLFADPATIADQVRALGGALPSDVQDLIIGQLTARSQQTGALSIGLIASLVIALWSASGGVANLVQAINTAYEETKQRNLLRKRALALVLTLGAIVFMIILISLVAVLPVIFAFIESGSLRWVVQIIRWLLIAVLIMVALAVLYRFAPNRTPARLTWTSPGAIVATAMWLLVSAGFSLYVTFFASYAKTYGALAGIVVLLMWLWLTSYAVLFGAKINASSEQQTLLDSTIGPDKPIGERGAVAADVKPALQEDGHDDLARRDDTDGDERDVAALETELVATRARLAGNVGALAAKADLKAQVKKRAAETTRRAAVRAEETARRSPALTAAAAVGVGVVIGLLVRRGRR